MESVGVIFVVKSVKNNCYNTASFLQVNSQQPFLIFVFYTLNDIQTGVCKIYRFSTESRSFGWQYGSGAAFTKFSTKMVLLISQNTLENIFAGVALLKL